MTNTHIVLLRAVTAGGVNSLPMKDFVQILEDIGLRSDVIAGNPVVGGLHGPTRHFFCSRCMSWMFTRPEGMDEFVNLRPSILDDHSWFVPFIEVWTQERLPWASTPAVHSFATQPRFEDYAKLIGQFAQEGARPT
jgi:hypothetical protein